MKRITTVLMLAMLVILASCEKETVLTVDLTDLSYTDAGGSQTITIIANKPWTISASQSWCKVSPSGGEEAAGSRISVSCDANTTYDARSCTVTVTCAELMKTISISQATNNGLMLSQTSYDLTKEAQQLNIEVKANVQFSVEVDSGCKDWVRYNTTKGLTNSTVILDIAENTSYDGREGKVTIKQNGGSLSSTITIKQSQLDGLFISSPGYRISNESHTLTVEVKSNIEFDVKSEVDWIKYVETKGLKTNQIVLDIAANDTYDLREGKVIVKQTNGNLSGTITILQDEQYGLFVSPEEISVSNQSTVVDFEVMQNVDYDIIIPDDAKSWISLIKTKGLKTDNINFSIAQNKSYSERASSVTFKQKNGPLSATVTIVQAQTDFLAITPISDTVSFEADTTQFSVTTNVPYTLSIQNNVNWLSVNAPEKGDTVDGLTTYFYRVSVQENVLTSQRTAEVIVKSDNNVFSAKFTLIQRPDAIISFADAQTKEICLKYWDKNGDGELSMGEAAKVKRLGEAFKTSQIKSFNEFKYFISVTEIDKWAFLGATSIKEITFPENLVSVGQEAFQHCWSLTSIVFNNNLKEIKLAAFNDCSSLESINLPVSLISIENLAFGSTAIRSIFIPMNVTDIIGNIVMRCFNLERIEGKYSSADKRCIIKDGVLLSFAPKNITTYTFSSDVKKVEGGVFTGLSKIEQLAFSSQTSEFGNSAFKECTSLKKVSFGNHGEGVSSLGHMLFQQCYELVEVDLSKAVHLREIPQRLLYHSGVGQFIIPESVEIIGPQSLNGVSIIKCLPIEPPILNSTYPGQADAFSKGCKIYVPANSVQKYKDAYTWSEYENQIYPIE